MERENHEKPRKRLKVSNGSPGAHGESEVGVLSRGGRNMITRFEGGSSFRKPELPALLQDRECKLEQSRQPFPLIQIDGLFREDVLQSVRRQLLTQTTYTARSNDLFSYSGTDDLADGKVVPPNSPLALLRNCLYSKKVMRFFGDLLNVRLSMHAKPDLSSHIYREGDFLACHDDSIISEVEGEGRRMAFVLCAVLLTCVEGHVVMAIIIDLVDEWTEADGGSLDLYAIDVNGFPDTAMRHVFPQPGRLVLFEVSPISYHQVAEVLSNRPRLSISGWFSGPSANRAQLAPLNPRFLAAEMLHDFLNPTLLEPEVSEAMREAFTAENYLIIPHFLHSERFSAILQETQERLRNGIRVGPASARKFTVADPPDNALLSFFRSTGFRDLLKRWTGLHFVEHRLCYRILESGDYSLLHDQVQDPVGLDLILGLQPSDDDMQKRHGGFQHYVLSAAAATALAVNNPDCESLLSSPPSSNVLTIVLRDPSTLKYIDRVKRLEGDWRRIDVDGLYTLGEAM